MTIRKTLSLYANVRPVRSKEPFIDIAVGGHEIPNGDPNELQVWAVTVLGRVVVRQGVTTTSPEGTGWLSINTPNNCEVGQISVAASGLAWAVTWNGKALIRLGVSRRDRCRLGLGQSGVGLRVAP